LDENKKETKNEIQSLDEIFNYSNELLKTIEQFE
jgi:ferritin-like metal-binding protein YciE